MGAPGTGRVAQCDGRVGGIFAGLLYAGGIGIGRPLYCGRGRGGGVILVVWVSFATEICGCVDVGVEVTEVVLSTDDTGVVGIKTFCAGVVGVVGVTTAARGEAAPTRADRTGGVSKGTATFWPRGLLTGVNVA